MSKKQIKPKDEISEQLAEIYKNSDGTLPDMTNFEKRKSLRIMRAFFTLLFSCIFLVAVVLVGIFFFKPQVNFSKDSVTVAVGGEDNVSSGQLTHYRIRYHNGEDVSITKVKVSIRYPAGFIFKESSAPATSDKNNEWDVGTLAAQENGFLDIYGTMYGDLGAEESMRVFLNYTPSNFNSEFQSVGIWKITIGESPVVLSVTAPSTTVPGALTTLVFTLTPREASTTLQNISLVIDPGTGFTQKNSNPPSDNLGAWTWTVPTLKGEKSITVSGAFATQPGVGDYTLKAKLMGSLSVSSTQKTFVLDQKEYHVTFAQSQLAVDFTINGASDSLAVSPGEMLRVSSTIQNNFSSPVSNIHASVIFDAPSFQNKSILNWPNIQDVKRGKINGQQIGTDIRRGTVVWDKSQIKEFANLAAGSQSSVSFQIPVKTAIEAPLANFKEHVIHATLEVQYEMNGKKQVFVSSPIEITLNSDFAVSSTIEKKQSAQGGQGAGENQMFVTWKIQNSAHEMKNVVLSGNLYGDIIWQTDTSTVPVGTLVFDEKEKTIVWKADTLAAQEKPVEVTFSFIRKTYNPTQTQLMSKIQLSGHDTITGKDVIVFGAATPNTF